MSTKQKLIYSLVGLVIGFAAGFAFANGVNRAEHDKLRAEVARLNANASDNAGIGKSGNSNNSGQPSAQQTLSPEEIREKIAQADANPKDLEFQRNLGRGLYLYAVNFNQTDLMPDIIRLLKRASEADPKDDNTLILIGNAFFLMGQNGDTARFAEARSYYQKVVELKPKDVYARTATGLCYFFDRPSDPQSAIREYRKALALEPRHEMTLQGLAAALIATGELVEAQKRIEELESVNASNSELADLRSQLAQKKQGAQGGQNSGASGADR